MLRVGSEQRNQSRGSIVKATKYLLVFVALGLGGCGGTDDPLPAVLESDGFAVTKPKSAPPGSLGGICGVNYEECPDKQTMFSRFVNLPRTNVSASRTVKNLDKPNNSRQITLKYRVPRMVNDHKESQDQIEVASIAANCEGASCDYKTTFKRNGAVVGTFEYRKNGSKTENVDVTKGGWETTMSYSADVKSFSGDAKAQSVLVRMTEEVVKAQGAKNGKPGNNFCGEDRPDGVLNSKCGWCRAGKVVAGAAPGAGAAAIALYVNVRRGFQILIGTVGALAGNTAGELIDCGPVCSRANCQEQYCEGRIDQDEFDVCCRVNGGALVHTSNPNVLQCSNIDDII